MTLLVIGPAGSLITKISGFEGKNFNIAKANEITEISDSKPQKPENKQILSTQDNLPNTPESVEITEFSIEIPKINLKKEVHPNTSPTNPNIYLPIIEKNVAHGQYTALPTEEKGNVYLFAHSRKYSGEGTPKGGWFTRIDELALNDVIYIHFNGRIYRYKVAERRIITPDQIDVYTNVSPFSERKSLTLQTCFPRGETEKRLIIIAVNE